jgi:capsular polysaccharide biosynthesis protein
MSYKIYGPLGFKMSFANKTKNRAVKSGLAVQEIDDGIIALDSCGYGVFDAYRNFVPLSVQTRTRYGQSAPMLDNIDDIPFMDAEVVYMGNLFPYFGHFLLENLNRAWALGKGFKVVFVNDMVCRMQEYGYELLRLLGIKKQDVIVLDKTMRFRKVIVPQQAFNMSMYSSLEFASVYKRMSDNVKSDGQAPEKVYLSRVKMGERKTIGEEKVQDIFRKNGYTVIYPETMPIARQIAALKNCKLLAGCAGTALHMAVFMPDGGRVVQIKRNKMSKCNAPLQYLINQSKNIESVFVAGSVEDAATRHNTKAPQIIGVNKYMRDFFRDFGFDCRPSDFKADSDARREYRRLMKEYKRESGGVLWGEIKHLAVKLAVCMIPGRERRKRFRALIRRKLKSY